MREAIINYINARAERIRPCKHDWEKKESWNLTNVDTGITKDGAIVLYICKKCGEFKKFELLD